MIVLESGLKDTEMGPLPYDWEVVPLETVVTILDHKRVPLSSTQRAYMQGVYPYCGANGIIDHINDYLFDGEYVLLAEDGGYWGPSESSSYVMNGKFWVNNHAHILQAISGVSDNHFLMYLLNFQNISLYISGTTRGKLNQGVLRKLPIPLPPLPEQRAIAHVLSTVREAIEATERVIVAARELKRSLMKYLFTYGPVPIDQADQVQLKETEIGEVPEFWHIERLGNIADVEYGIQAAVASNTDSSIGIPILTNTNITLEGLIDLSTLRYYNLSEREQHKILRKGDVLFNWRSGSQHHVGKSAVFDIDGDYTCSSFILRLRVGEEINNKFLANQLHALWDRGHFAQRRSQSSVNSVFNKSATQEIPIVYPKIIDQLVISNYLSAISDKIYSEVYRKSALEALFNSLLHHLMTGKVRVPPESFPK